MAINQGKWGFGAIVDPIGLTRVSIAPTGGRKRNG
jgi:hypothetical protein